MQLSPTLSLKVNPASGNLMIHSDDLKVPSKGMEFDSARTWNSLQNEAFGYGYGWVDSNAPSVHVTPTGSVAYTDGTGATFPFVKERANFATPPGIEATMCEAGSAAPCPVTLPKGTTYQLIYTNTQERINFAGNKEYNYPQEILDAAGEAETAKYTKPLEEPTTWTDTEKVKIAYTESESLGYTKITNEGNKHSVSYTEKVTEDGLPHLLKYTNENKETTSYTIGTGLEGNLIKEIIEPSGTVIKLSYDSQYRITKIIKTTNAEHTTGPTTTYTYYGYGKAPAPCTATQKATVIAETGGSEEPTLTYCSNVLDEVEEVSGYPGDGQPGGYSLEEEQDSETETAAVNLWSGDLFVKAEDVAPEEVDQYVSLDRFYNSQAMPISSVLGPRWRWGTGPAVYLALAGATVVVHGPSGYAVVLRRASATTFTAPSEYEGTLTRNGDGTFTLTDADNPTYEFTSSGILVNETTQEGNAFRVVDGSLAGTSVLQQLVAASGAKLEVKYNATPRVTQTIDPAGRSDVYEYNGAGQLASFTTSGVRTEYGYAASGYLNRIATAESTEAIFYTGNKVSEISVTRTGETSPSVEKFTYQSPTGPACNPVSDVEETTVASPEEEAQTYCFNARGENTTPPSEEESEELDQSDPGPEIPAGTCYEAEGFTSEECGQGEPAPENPEAEGEEGAGFSRDAHALATQPHAVEFGISENNRVSVPIHGEPLFEYFSNPIFEKLNVANVRRTVPWNTAYEATRTAIQNETALEKESKAEAQSNLSDVEAWVTKVKALHGKLGKPLISIDRCSGGKAWVNPKTHTQESCGEVPQVAEYEEVVAKFFTTGDLPEVKQYTAWNEPNNTAPSKSNGSERAEPTWNHAELAGKYWRKLQALCEKHGCKVAAGDFIDGSMPNADKYEYYNPSTKKEEVTYFWKYVHGMGHAETVATWAWHAYHDGKETQKHYKGQPHKWWQTFHNFVAAINLVGKKEKRKPDIWLTEQGVVYAYGKTEVQPAGRHLGTASAIMRDYVHDGDFQLTHQKGQIMRFYYYDMRGARNNPGAQDSGLLEVPEKPYGKPENTPRAICSIYSLYATKTGRC